MLKKIIMFLPFYLFLIFVYISSYINIYNEIEFEYSQIEFNNDIEHIVNSYDKFHNVIFVEERNDYYYFILSKYYLRKHIKIKKGEILLPNYFDRKKILNFHFLALYVLIQLNSMMKT